MGERPLVLGPSGSPTSCPHWPFEDGAAPCRARCGHRDPLPRVHPQTPPPLSPTLAPRCHPARWWAAAFLNAVGNRARVFPTLGMFPPLSTAPSCLPGPAACSSGCCFQPLMQTLASPALEPIQHCSKTRANQPSPVGGEAPISLSQGFACPLEGEVGKGRKAFIPLDSSRTAGTQIIITIH